MSGQLLVATPLIAEPTFGRSVVYLLDHDEDGALGVIINRPLSADVHDVLPAWAPLVTQPDCIFSGGPVSDDLALAVGVLSGTAEPEGWQPMTGQVGIVDLDETPGIVVEALAGLRVFAGYAGWSPGQLEDEIAEGSWVVVEGSPDDLTTPHPEGLWRAVLQRQEAPVRFLTTYPEDPGDN